MRSLFVFCCIALLTSLSGEAQTKIFDCEIEQKRSYQVHHVVDRSLNKSYLVISSYDQVDIIALDSIMQMSGKRSYSIGLKEEKHYLTELLTFTADNGIIHGFYANHNLTIVGFLEFNMRTKRGVRRGQLPIDLNRKDEFLFHYVSQDIFYLASATKKTSVIKVYAVRSPKNIKRSLIRVDVYRNLHDMFKTFSEPKPMDVGVVIGDADLSVTSKKIKAYPSANALRITFETVAGTEIIDLDLPNQTYTDDIIHYRKFKNAGSTNNTNSFLSGDLNYIARSSGAEIFVYAERKGEIQSLFQGRFAREDEEIPFANELPTGEKIWTSSRFYRNTPKDLIRDIDDGNIGISVAETDTSYVLTVGNFKETTNPLTDPYGSKISGRNEGESSYFKVQLSREFEHFPGALSDPDQTNLTSFFTEKELKARYVYTFNVAESEYVFFQDKKEKLFSLYQLD